MKVRNNEFEFIIGHGYRRHPKSLYYFRILKQDKYIEFKFHPLYIVIIMKDNKVLPTIEGKYFKGFGLKITIDKVYIKEQT
jgi:hypothetical protein